MSYFKRTWPFGLVVFVLPLVAIFISGIYGNYISIQSVNDGVNYYFNGEFIRTLTISISTSLIAAGIVYLFIDKKLRELLAHDEVITVILKTDKGVEKKCPPMPRKDFSRAEVLGYIGMLCGAQRFDIASLKTPVFGENLLKTSKSKGAQPFMVDCTDAEMEQFDVVNK